jgi:DNA polymerase III alpha subunit
MIQLRIRTEYTFGRTYAPIGKIVQRLLALGVTHAGIVDNDSTWGHVPWYKALKAAGINPMLGVSLTVSEVEDVTTRMWFLARNTAGLKELYRLSSKAYLQMLPTKFGGVPRLFHSDVIKMSDNIYKFAGDILDESLIVSSNAILDFNKSSRVATAAKTSLLRAHPWLRTVETCDNYYSDECDSKVHSFMSYAREATVQQHIHEVKDSPTALEIAAEVTGMKMPIAPMIHADGDLRQICLDGANKRGLSMTQQYKDRLEYELKTIEDKKFTSYFIIVDDMVKYAKRHMLVGPSRGSAAGSLVCYTSGITEIDPIPPGLYFERFIDVNRSDLPDIDLDFPDAKRDMVFQYMAQKYGQDRTCHIGTVAAFKPKSALIQVAKRLGIPPSETAAVKLAIVERGLADARSGMCLMDTFTDTDSGRRFIEQYPEAKYACDIEGHASHTGIHAAGLLICNDCISEYCTVDHNGIAHVDKYSAEYLGLLKIDVLGLRTLTILEDSGVPIDWYNLPLNDKRTFDLFNRKSFCGIFQFDGDAMKSVADKIDFQSIVQIDAVTALARPGPFGSGVAAKYLERAGGAPYKRSNPLVEKLMQHTFGLPLYQEDTLAIVRIIGGFSWEDTSFVRRAISKRQGIEFFQKFFPAFLEGAKRNGLSELEAREIWDSINAMGSWQMNKAHTYSYAVISYWTAYLKANHPLEFTASTLRHAKDEDSSLELLREFSREGYKFVYFDPLLSAENWSVKNGMLYGGVMSLKGYGPSKAAKFIEKRNAGTLTKAEIETALAAESPYKDIFPFKKLFGHIYSDPKSNMIAGRVSYISELENIPHRAERCFIGTVIHKNPRNMNEGVYVKRRNGVIATGQTDFLDIRLRDDTGMIAGRIGAKDYLRIGVELQEKVPIGANILVKALFFNGIRYAFIYKWKLL